MAIKFPTKKSAPVAVKKVEPKKVNKKVEEEEVEEDEEETAEAEEAEEVEEESDEEEAEETVEEEEAEEAEDTEEEEEEDSEEEEEDEEEEKKPVKKVVKPIKKAAAPAKKSAPAKKGIKTGSLASFGQKVSASKESWTFDLTVGDEVVKCDVPGKKPSDEGRLQREQLISICTCALSKATNKEYSKKDIEFIFGVFEETIKQITEDYSISFMGKHLKRIEIKERAFPALKSKFATLVPAHYELRYRRVCHQADGSADPIKIKAGKDGKPLTDKKGNYIPVED